MAKKRSKKWRALVVGCGSMGRGWIRNINNCPRCELAGVVDINQAAFKRAIEECGVDPAVTFTDLKRAIRTVEPDFVVDVTIPEGHCPTTITALKMGRPVIGEKPMADSMAAARKMVAAAKRARLLYMVSQNRRYDPKNTPARDLLQAGTIGNITTVNCDFYIGAHFGGFRDQMASPLILDMSIHHFDLCRYLTGADPVAVYAHEFNPKGSWYRGDVAASVIFEMTNGVVFTYRGSWCAEGCSTSWHGNWRFVGDRGTAMLENDQPGYAEVVKNMKQKAFIREMKRIPAKTPKMKLTGIAGSLAEFLAALESGKTPQCECRDNIKSLAMVFAAIESAKAGRRVRVRI